MGSRTAGALCSSARSPMIRRWYHFPPGQTGAHAGQCSFLAVGETVIRLHPPAPLVGVSVVMERGRQQNDSLVRGYSFPGQRGNTWSLSSPRPMRQLCQRLVSFIGKISFPPL